MITVLADENIPEPVVELLRQHDFDVLYALQDFPSEPDSYVIKRAIEEKRLLLTSDVELAAQTLRIGKCHFGTILLRMGTLKPGEVAQLVLHELQTGTNWTILHSVLSPGKVRSRTLEQLDQF